MPAIRWMNYAGVYQGIDSLKWEFSSPNVEVSAEWTIKGRPFIIPQRDWKEVSCGLLLKTSAINRRFKRDGGTGGPQLRKSIPKDWRKKSLINKDWLDQYPWECLCKPNYIALVINNLLFCSANIKIEDTLNKELEFCKEREIPVLIYQASNSDSDCVQKSWSLLPYRELGIKGTDNQEVLDI